MCKKVLVLAPHTDDGELGCGGYVSKLIREGNEIYYVAFSAAEKSVPVQYDRDILRREVVCATHELGIKSENLRVLNYEVREFPQHRQEILDDLIKLRAEIKPDLVLIPSLNDLHQDHYTVAHEAVRAFKNTNMLGYELPWNNLTINTTSFAKLDKIDVENKYRALACYESQKGRPYANSEFITSLAKVRGTQIGAEFAEIYEVIRLIL